MKNSLKLIVLFLLCPVLLHAQEQAADAPRNIIRVAPLGFVNKVRLHYERVLGNTGTIGLIGTGYYGLFDGVKAEPFVRLYMTNPAPRGLYFQAKMSYGSYSADLCKDWDEVETDSWDWDDRHAAGWEDDCLGEVSFTTVGADIGLGAQGFIGKKKRTSIDFCLSLQYNPLRQKFRNQLDQTGFADDWKTSWYLLYGGAVVAPMFSIGRAF